MPVNLLPDNLLGLVQSMVTPAVMISACGLLLLSVSNKLGRIVDRIRDVSVRNQIDLLVRRAAYLRNACGLLYLAVTVFAVTSLCIGLSRCGRVLEVLMLLSFVAGLGIVVWAGLLAYREIRLSHHAVTEEIKELRLHD
jgi:hypothetical protein